MPEEALVGFGLGFADRRFLRGVRRPSAWGLGVMAGLVIVFCGMAQVVANRREAPLRRQALLRAELNAREIAYRNLRAAPMLLDQKADHRLLASGLDAIAGVLDRGTTRSDFRRLRELAAVAVTRSASRKRRRPSSSSGPGLFQHSFAASSTFASASSGRNAARRTPGTGEWDVRSSSPARISGSQDSGRHDVSVPTRPFRGFSPPARW